MVCCQNSFLLVLVDSFVNESFVIDFLNVPQLLLKICIRAGETDMKDSESPAPEKLQVLFVAVYTSTSKGRVLGWRPLLA